MAGYERISRRRFGWLTGGIAAGMTLGVGNGSPVWSVATGSETMANGSPSREAVSVDRNRIVWVSDTHIPTDTETEINGTHPARNLTRIFEQIAASSPHPAAVCFCGDIAALEGKIGDYRSLRGVTAILDDAGIPWYAALGNHDNREAFYEVFPEKFPKTLHVEGKHTSIVETPHADLILLDSLIRSNFTPGSLGEEQIAWIGAELKRRREADSMRNGDDAGEQSDRGLLPKPVYFAAHHPLVPGSSDAHSGLLDTDAFLKAVQDDEMVRGYIFGHSHAWGRHKTFMGMTLPVPDVMALFLPPHLTSVNIPATGWLFGDQPRGWVEMQIAESGDATFTLRTLAGDDPRNGNFYRLP